MKLIPLLLLFFSLNSQAWNCDPEKPEDYAKCLEEVEKALSTEVRCDPEVAAGEAAAPPSKCDALYEKSFSDGTFNITIANGYYDASPDDGVYGEYWANLTIEKLTAACPASFELLALDKYQGTQEEKNGPKKDREHTGCGQKGTYSNSCGFTRTDNPEILQKKVVVNGKPKMVQVRLLNSALTMSDKQNRASERKMIEVKFCVKVPADKLENCIKQNTPPKISKEKLKSTCTKSDVYLYQVCKSEYVKNAWKNAITNGDEMVVYDGHARDGGGPSFDPPRLLKNGHVDYPWYRQNRVGHNEEAAAFKEAVKKGKSPLYYGSMSCNGYSHFFKRGKFPEVSPSTSYILSKRTSYPDEGLASLLTTIDGALTKQCGENLDKKIEGAGCAFKLFNY